MGAMPPGSPQGRGRVPHPVKSTERPFQAAFSPFSGMWQRQRYTGRRSRPVAFALVAYPVSRLNVASLVRRAALAHWYYLIYLEAHRMA